MNPREISDNKVLQDLVIELLNRIEEFIHSNKSLQAQLSEAQDEINRLKGEKGKPKFSGKGKGKVPKLDLGKASDKKDSKTAENSLAESDLPAEIDRTEVVARPPSDLPTDAEFKGYREVVHRDIRIERVNTVYRIARWYSASTGKTYESSLPEGVESGLGARLRSFIQILHHGGDMTHRKIQELLSHLGIDLSKGTVSNVLTHSDWVESEYEELLKSSLSESPYVQIDSTSSREQGQGMHTQIMCGEFFTLFSTQEGRSRTDVYAALQGKSRQELKLAYTPLAIELMEAAKVSKKHLAYLAEEFEPGQLLDFHPLEKQHFEKASVFEKTNKGRRSVIAGALAAGYYHQQDQVPKVSHLLSDEALEYQKVATEKQFHCWVHAIRLYRKLSPTQEYLRSIHTDFMDKIWKLYGNLKQYQKDPPEKRKETKEKLRQEFETVFTPNTDYQALNKQIQHTPDNQEFLLAFLECPYVPLHNNAAERGARRVVRKRDISLHTWSKRGTKIKDAFMSLFQTAKKLGISFLDYLSQRNVGITNTPTIAQILVETYRSKPTAF